MNEHAAAVISALRTENEALKLTNKRLEEACNLFEANSADAAQLWEDIQRLKANVVLLQSEKDTIQAGSDGWKAFARRAELQRDEARDRHNFSSAQVEERDVQIANLMRERDQLRTALAARGNHDYSCQSFQNGECNCPMGSVLRATG